MCSHNSWTRRRNIPNPVEGDKGEHLCFWHSTPSSFHFPRHRPFPHTPPPLSRTYLGQPHCVVKLFWTPPFRRPTDGLGIRFVRAAVRAQGTTHVDPGRCCLAVLFSLPSLSLCSLSLSQAALPFAGRQLFLSAEAVPSPFPGFGSDPDSF